MMRMDVLFASLRRDIHVAAANIVLVTNSPSQPSATVFARAVVLPPDVPVETSGRRAPDAG